MTGLTLARTALRAVFRLALHSCYIIMCRPAQVEQQRTDLKGDTIGTEINALQEYESHFDHEALALWNALQSTEDFSRSPSADNTLAQVCKAPVTLQPCVASNR